MIVNDIIMYTILISFFLYFANTSIFKKILIVLVLSIISVYIEYDVFLKKVRNIDNYNTILYLIIDYIHAIVFFSVFFFVCITIKLNCKIKYLFILNIFGFGSILSFFYFKQCFLTFFMYQIINVKLWVSPFDRLKYLLGIDKNYNIVYKHEGFNEAYNWINGQYLLMSVLLLLNVYCFVKKVKC